MIGDSITAGAGANCGAGTNGERNFAYHTAAQAQLPLVLRHLIAQERAIRLRAVGTSGLLPAADSAPTVTSFSADFVPVGGLLSLQGQKNADETYGAITARNLHADVHIIAASGKGIRPDPNAAMHHL